jgi:hypothetical protein
VQAKRANTVNVVFIVSLYLWNPIQTWTLLAPGIANGIRGLLAIWQLRAVGFPGLVVEVAELPKVRRQPFLAFGKGRRLDV